MACSCKVPPAKKMAQTVKIANPRTTTADASKAVSKILKAAYVKARRGKRSPVKA